MFLELSTFVVGDISNGVNLSFGPSHAGDYAPAPVSPHEINVTLVDRTARC
jgi:hypothetical protein